MLRRMLDRAEAAEQAARAVRTEYETRVRALRAVCEQMRREGHDDETIARAMHAERRKLAAQFKALTPKPVRPRVEAHVTG
jgi:AraC-like DNA-binding protein